MAVKSEWYVGNGPKMMSKLPHAVPDGDLAEHCHQRLHLRDGAGGAPGLEVPEVGGGGGGKISHNIRFQAQTRHSISMGTKVEQGTFRNIARVGVGEAKKCAKNGEK